MLAATTPLIGNSQQDEAEEELETALIEMEAAIDALVELESEYVLRNVMPVLEPLVPIVPAVLTDAVNAAGISLQLGRLGIAVHTPSDDGIQVNYVLPQSSAAKTGLQRDDTIVSINGATVETILDDPGQFQVLVPSNVEDDDPVSFVVLRDGKELKIEVENKTTPASMSFETQNIPTAPTVAGGPPAIRYWRARVANNALTGASMNSSLVTVLEIEKEIGYYFGVEYGVLVVETPSGHDEFKPGDIVLRIDDNPIRSYSHLERYVAKASSTESVKVRVKRRGKTMNVDFSPNKWLLVPVYEYD